MLLVLVLVMSVWLWIISSRCLFFICLRMVSFLLLGDSVVFLMLGRLL